MAPNEIINEGKPKSKKSEKKVENVEKPRKSQRIKVLISVYRYGDVIVSALGIPSRTSVLSHQIPKNELKPEQMFDIIKTLNNESFFIRDQTYKETVSQAIDDKKTHIIFPSKRASDLKNVGGLVHEILSTEIELFIK